MAALTIEVLAEHLFPTHREYMSVREVSEQTTLSERHVRRLVSNGRLASCKLGSRRLVRRDSLNELLKD